MNLLLAQIGNRHIQWKGNFFQKSDEFSSFRAWSQFLQQRAQEDPQFLNELELQILPEFLRQLPEDELNGAHFLLFHSNTPATLGRNDQDTLFAAELVKSLLCRHYGFQETQVQVETLSCLPVDLEGLVQRHLMKVRKASRSLSPTAVYLCDSGATHQMKTSLREVSDLVFGERLKIIQVHDGTSSSVEIIESAAHRKIGFSKLAIALLQKGELASAAILLQDLVPESDKQSLNARIYDLLVYRSRGFVGLTWNALQRSLPKEAPEWLLELHNFKTEFNWQAFQVHKREGFQWVERLLLSEFLLARNQFEWACLYLNQAIENLLSALIEQLKWKKWKPKDSSKVEEGAIYLEDLCLDLLQYAPAATFLNDHREEWDNYRPEAMVSKYFMLLMAGPELWKPLLEKHIPQLLSQANPDEKYQGVDHVRNKFAHDGKTAEDSVREELTPIMRSFIQEALEMLSIDYTSLSFESMMENTVHYLRHRS